jgi:hypothetical protein
MPSVELISLAPVMQRSILGVTAKFRLTLNLFKDSDFHQ